MNKIKCLFSGLCSILQLDYLESALYLAALVMLTIKIFLGYAVNSRLKLNLKLYFFIIFCESVLDIFQCYYLGSCRVVTLNNLFACTTVGFLKKTALFRPTLGHLYACREQINGHLLLVAFNNSFG